MGRPPDSWRFSLSAFPIPENPPPTPSAGVRITAALRPFEGQNASCPATGRQTPSVQSGRVRRGHPVEPSRQKIRGKRVREAKTTLPPPVLPLLPSEVPLGRFLEPFRWRLCENANYPRTGRPIIS